MNFHKQQVWRVALSVGAVLLFLLSLYQIDPFVTAGLALVYNWLWIWEG